MSESVASFRSGVSGLSSVAAFDLRDDGLDELALAGDLNRIKGQLEDFMNEAFFCIQEFRLDEDWKVSSLFAFLEWAQVALFLLDPVWGWGFRWDAGPWRWARRIQLQKWVADSGHRVWTAVFFFIGAVLAFIIVGAVFVAKQRRTRKAPEAFVTVLRVACLVFLGVFNLSAFSCLLMAVACNWGRRGTVEGTLTYWPDQKCISEGHAVQGAFALFLFLPLWMAISAVYAISSPLPFPRTTIVSAAPDSTTALRSLILRSVTAVAFYIFVPGGQLKLLSLIFLGLSLAMAVNWTVHGTHFNPRFRAARAAGAGVFFYASLALVIRIHHENRHVFVDTLALALGSPIAGAVAAAISFALWRRDTRAAAGILAETRAAQRIDPGISAAALRIDFQFGSIEQVHRLAAVLARTAMTSRLCPPDISFAVEAIFLSGIRQFPESALLHVLSARFAMDLAEGVQSPDGAPGGADRADSDGLQRAAVHVPPSAIAEVERAKSLHPTWSERYLVFSADTELKEISQRDAASEESAMDLQGYVDFQNDFARVNKSHRAAVLVKRRFWRLMCKEHISFSEIDAAFHDMQRYDLLADRSYRAALEKRPMNVKLLRAYARFIEEVLKDPFRAHHVRGEAEKRERAAEAKTRRTSAQHGAVDERVDAVVVATAAGTIKMANKNLHRLFGYKKDELPGKNISVLMGAPYNQLHAGYVKRYLQTQKSTILDTQRRLEGKHKNGKLFPMAIRVTRIESAGGAERLHTLWPHMSSSGVESVPQIYPPLVEQQVCFLGVMRAVVAEHATATISADDDAVILAANDALAELLGYNAGSDLVGQPAALLLQPEAEDDLHAAIAVAMSGEEVDHLFPGCLASGESLPLSLEVALADLPEEAVTVRFTSLAGHGLLTTDDMGNIRSANQLLSRLFGYSNATLCRMNIAGLAPRPYGRFHSQYLNRYRDFHQHGKATTAGIVGSSIGHIVPALHKDGAVFWCRLEIHEIPDESRKIAFTAKISIETAAGSPDDPRTFVICVRTRLGGKADASQGPQQSGPTATVESVNDHMETLLGVPPSDLLNLPLGKVLQGASGSEHELVEALRILCGPEDALPYDVRPFIPATFVRPDGATVEVALGRLRSLDAHDPENPELLHVQVWVLSRVEGLIEITQDGTITSASLGALITLGYLEEARDPEHPRCGGVRSWCPRPLPLWLIEAGASVQPLTKPALRVRFIFPPQELIGVSVNTLMPAAVAAHHDRFLEAARGKRLVMSRRIVDALHQSGSTIRVLLEVSDADKGRLGGPAYVARICSRTTEPLTPLPASIQGSVNQQPRNVADVSTPLLLQLPARRTTVNSEMSGPDGGGLGRPRHDRSGKDLLGSNGGTAGAAAARTQTALQKRAASMLWKKGAKLKAKKGLPGGRPSAMTDAVSEQSTNLPGVVPETPAPQARMSVGAGGNDLSWVESNNLQERARRVSVAPSAANRRQSREFAEKGETTSGRRVGSDANSEGSRAHPLRGGKISGSGVWSYNPAADIDAGQRSASPEPAPDGDAAAPTTGGASSSSGLPAKPQTRSNWVSEKDPLLPQIMERAAADAMPYHPTGVEPVDHDGGLLIRTAQSTHWSVSDGGSSADPPDVRLTPSAGLPAQGGKRAKSATGPAGLQGGGSSVRSGAADFLLERFQQDAMNAVVEFRSQFNAKQSVMGAVAAAADGRRSSGDDHVAALGAGAARNPLMLAMTSGEGTARVEKNTTEIRETHLTPETLAEGRAKRMRGILRLLNSPRMKAAIGDLNKQTRYILVLCSGVFVSAIAVVNVLITEHIVKMQQIKDIAEAIIRGVSGCSAARTLEQLQLLPSPSQIGDETSEEQPEYIESRADGLIVLLDGLYTAAHAYNPALALAPSSGATKSAFQAPFTFKVWEQPADKSPGRYVTQQVGAFDGANAVAANLRAIASYYDNGARDLSQLRNDAAFRFVSDNGASTFADAFLNVQGAQKDEAVALLSRAAYLQMILLVVNVVVFIVCILYFKHLLTRVAVERLSLYSVFLRAPRNVLMKLATQNVSVRTDDSDDESDEHGGSEDDDEDDDWTQRILLEQQAKKKQPLQHASGAADDEPGTLSGEIVTAAADPSVDGQNPFSAATEVTLDSMRPVRQENPMRDTSDTVQPTSGGDGGGEGAAGEVSMAASVAKGGGSAQALGAAPPGAVVHLPSAFSVRKGLFHPQLMWASPRNSTGTSPAPAEQTRKASVDAGQHRGAAQTTVAKPHAHTGKKKLQERGAASYVFLAPLIIWGMSTIASFAASYHLLFTTIDFVHQIRTAATTWQLGARVHHYAQELIAVRSVPYLPEDVEVAKTNLKAVIDDFNLHYDAILYGDASLSVKSSLLYNKARDELVWLSQQCLAGESCVEPGHPWYPRIASGLDALIYFYIESTTHMLDLEPEELVDENPFFNFMWEIGTHDVHDGLQKFTLMFNDDTHSNPVAAQTILISMFCAIIVANVLFVAYYFVPWMRRILLESTRVAHLLAELPNEMNVDALILQSTSAAGAVPAAERAIPHQR